MFTRTALASAMLVVASVSCRLVIADIFVLDAGNCGFVTEVGGSSHGDGTLVFPATFNYSVGQAEHFDDGSLTGALDYVDRKNYFIFSLAGVTDPIVSASLTLYMGPDTGPDYPAGEHGYESLDPTEEFVILETTDPGAAIGLASDIFSASLTEGPDAFDMPDDPMVIAAADLYSLLGDGTPLAGITTSSDDDGTFLTIDFTPAGIDYLNMFLGGPVLLAGSLPSVDGVDTTELIFGFTGPDVTGFGGGSPEFIPNLTVSTIPEPGTCILVLCGSVISFARRSRRTR